MKIKSDAAGPSLLREISQENLYIPTALSGTSFAIINSSHSCTTLVHLNHNKCKQGIILVIIHICAWIKSWTLDRLNLSVKSSKYLVLMKYNIQILDVMYKNNFQSIGQYLFF